MATNADTRVILIGWYAVCRVRGGNRLVLLHFVVQERRPRQDDREFGVTKT
jgi:hypothetical protein